MVYVMLLASMTANPWIPPKTWADLTGQVYSSQEVCVAAAINAGIPVHKEMNLSPAPYAMCVPVDDIQARETEL